MLTFVIKTSISSGSQEIHRILCSLKVYFRVYTNPPLVAIPSKCAWKVNGVLPLDIVSEYCFFKLPPEVSTFPVR
jgi:hypothetical protein